MPRDTWVGKLEHLRGEGLVTASYSAAHELLIELALHGINPGRIVATAEDTVSVWLWTDRRHSKLRIEACEDGEFVVTHIGVAKLTHTECRVVADVLDLLTPLTSLAIQGKASRILVQPKRDDFRHIRLYCVMIGVGVLVSMIAMIWALN